MLNRTLKRNIITAYLISAPIGLFTILLVFALPILITDEGLPTMLMVINYGWATLGLYISFLVAIWHGSKNAHQSLLNGKKVLSASFKFSLTINSIIWLIFIVIVIINKLYINSEFSLVKLKSLENGFFNLVYSLILPLIAFIISVIGTTFTIGLLISYLFDKNIKKSKVISETVG